MIHVFHGFLGSPADFSFLKELPHLKIYDLYQDEMPNVLPQDILIGYSMGGRVCLELAKKVQFKLKKVILVNAHPGLDDEDERLKRKEWEDVLIKKMETSAHDDFMSYWNALEIFKYDEPISGRPEHFHRSRQLFDAHRLSHQENYLPLLLSHQEKVHFLTGLQDQKYLKLAHDSLLPQNLNISFLEGGHRLFQKPAPLYKAIKLLID